MNIQTLGVVGAGTMGHGIAQAAAAAGCDVILRDRTDALVQRGVEAIDKSSTGCRPRTGSAPKTGAPPWTGSGACRRWRRWPRPIW